MAVTYLQMDFAGQSSVLPRRGVMMTTDSLETITTAGYLNQRQNAMGNNFFPNDFIFVNYNAPNGNAIGGAVGLFTLNFNNGVISMVVPTTDVPAFVQGVTPGTSAASKALSLDGSSNLNGVAIGSITAAGTYEAALTATAAEANLNHLQVASITTVSTTPASGSCAVQFQFKNAAGGNIAAITGLMMYASTSAGVPGGPATTNAALTNGSVIEISNGTLDFVACSASGALGVTLTATAGTYYLSFVLPNGHIAISSALVVNA